MRLNGLKPVGAKKDNVNFAVRVLIGKNAGIVTVLVLVTMIAEKIVVAVLIPNLMLLVIFAMEKVDGMFV